MITLLIVMSMCSAFVGAICIAGAMKISAWMTPQQSSKCITFDEMKSQYNDAMLAWALQFESEGDDASTAGAQAEFANKELNELTKTKHSKEMKKETEETRTTDPEGEPELAT